MTYRAVNCYLYHHYIAKERPNFISELEDRDFQKCYPW